MKITTCNQSCWKRLYQLNSLDPLDSRKGKFLPVFYGKCDWFKKTILINSSLIVAQWRHMAPVILVKLDTKPWASYQMSKIAGCACAGNAGNVFPTTDIKNKPFVSDPDMHHGTCVTHVPWCMPWSLTRGAGENHSRHSRCMPNPQFYVSGKRPITWTDADPLITGTLWTNCNWVTKWPSFCSGINVWKIKL